MSNITEKLDSLIENFVGEQSTNEEFERAQEFANQVFILAMDAQRDTISVLKAQLAQYQSDDYVSVKKSVVEQLIFELDYAFSEHKLLGLTDLIALRDGFSLLVDDEAQEQHNANP